jgi:hypothetical protein
MWKITKTLFVLLGIFLFSSSAYAVECTSSATELSILPCEVDGIVYDSEIIASQANEQYWYNVFWNSATSTFSYNGAGNGDLTASTQYYIAQANWFDNEPQLTLLSSGTTNVITLTYPYSEIAKYDAGEPDDYFIEFHIYSADEFNNIDLDTDCYTNSDMGLTTCSIIPNQSQFIYVATTTSLVEPYRFDFYVLDEAGVTYEPVAFYSYATTYTTAGEEHFYDGFQFPNGYATSTYHLKACVGDLFSSPLVYIGLDTTSICADMLVGNGFTDDELNSRAGLTSGNNLDTSWVDMNCDDVGILDVKKGVQCALIWAVVPQEDSLNRFREVKNNMLTIFPIGYATHIYNDLSSSLSSTSTDYFDRDIDVYKLFGKSGGTTTIDFDDMLQYKDFGSELFDFIELLMWFIFVVWLMMWGITREL